MDLEFRNRIYQEEKAIRKEIDDAIDEDDSQALSRILNRRLDLINTTTNLGATLITRAVSEGSVKCFNALLTLGADIHKKGTWNTPLYEALVISPNLDMAKELYRRGATGEIDEILETLECEPTNEERMLSVKFREFAYGLGDAAVPSGHKAPPQPNYFLDSLSR